MRTRKNNKKKNAAPNVLEMLEKRQLMAVISVTDFGARPNDGIDDTSAIRAAINASKPGDTISFAGGVFNLSDKIRFLSHRTYTGGGTLARTPGQDFIADTDGENTNIKINNLTFQGGGIHAGNGMAKGMEVTNTTFQNITKGWPTGNAILLSAGAEFSKFNNNKFLNIMGETGIYGFNRFHNVEMNNNYFDTVMEGIHLYYENGGDNLTVKNNTFIRMRRMAVELQGKGARNTLVEGNKASEWINNYHESFFLSIVNLGYNTIIRNNHGASGKFGEIDPKAKDTPVGIEISGWGVLVEGNVIEGFREGSHIMNIRDLVMRNNVFANQTWMGTWRTGISTGEFNGKNLRIENNTYYTSNTAFLFHGYSDGYIGNNTIYLYGSGKEYTEGSSGAYNNMNRAGNNVIRMSGSPTGYTGKSPVDNGGGTTNPVSQIPAAPSELVVTSKGTNRIDLVWKDNSSNEKGFKIQRRDNSTSTWVDIATVGANVKSYSDTSAKAGTHYSYRVLAYNDAGTSAWSNEHNATTDSEKPQLPGGQTPGGGQPTTPPTNQKPGTGTGLKGEYFDNLDLTNLKLTRTDGTINFDWGTGSPHASIGSDTFSVRWTGQIEARYSEEYTFFTTSDDGVRLWVNGQLIIDQWNVHAATTHTGKIRLEAGKKYDIKMEYFENTGHAVAMLGWSSASQEWEIVPQSQLFSAGTTETPAPSGSDLARGKSAYASSVQSDDVNWIAGLTDGDDSTRWASKLGSDNEWIYVDLGKSYNINRVKLNWETAFAKTYSIQVSNDGKTWTTIYSTDNGDGEIDDLTGLNGTGRYVRMLATERGYPAGFSLWSMEVYGA